MTYYISVIWDPPDSGGGASWVGVFGSMWGFPHECMYADVYMLKRPVQKLQMADMFIMTNVCVSVCMWMCIHVHVFVHVHGGYPSQLISIYSNLLQNDWMLFWLLGSLDDKSEEWTDSILLIVSFWPISWQWVGSSQNTRNWINLDQIKIIQICLKIYDL